MKYVDEFRNTEICLKLAAKISKIASNTDTITLMEVCGTHTMSIARYGIKNLLPNVKLLSGPGCPVCVTSNSQIDQMIAYSRSPGIIIATFGDMIHVPGSTSSLEKERASGADVRIVYSVADAVRIAKNNPDKRVIFLGVGFETTSPTVAASIEKAYRLNLKNYFVFSAHKLIPPAMKTILDKGVKISGFLLPGHVCTITGTEDFNFIANEYRIPCVVAGFEPIDILYSIWLLIHQIENKRSVVEIGYKRAVKKEGNLMAKKSLNEVFKSSATEWRGMGTIAQSGLEIKEKYEKFDVEKNVEVRVEPTKNHPDCICGSILQGLCTPEECKLFGTGCTPENPVGPCMVSSEGTCAARYKYGGYKRYGGIG
jgi:hydrogenase expression/formation protein HypD